VREIVVAANAARHLTVREVERAWAVPRPADAPPPESVALQLAQLHLAANGDADAPVSLLAKASGAARQIVGWAARCLGQDAPPLEALIRLLKPFDRIEPKVDAEPAMTNEEARGPQTHCLSDTNFATRDDVLQSIHTAREWFESHEPSSPVAVLLTQAERMVGKRFSQVADAIPLDLLQKWDSAGEIPR
jgi:type VI secretion system protein ImpA